MNETILKELAVIEEALSLVCDRIDNKDRISDCLLREVMQCVENIRAEVKE